MKSKSSTYLILTACIISAVLLSGCIRDDRSDCQFPLRLHFSYLYNRENADLLRAEVPTLHLSLYDADGGRLVTNKILPVSDLDDDNSISWLVPAGEYTLVVWGGIDAHYTLDSPASLSSARLRHTDGQAVSQRHEHLWHRAITNISVTGDLARTVDVDLHKLTNDLTVNIEYDGPAAIATTAEVSASNGLYSALGTIPADAYTSTYSPASTDRSHFFTIGYLAPGDDSNLRIVIPREARADDTEIFNGSLSGLLAADPDLDLDLDDDFTLNFTISPNGSNAAVSVTVNQWHIVDYNVVLK